MSKDMLHKLSAILDRGQKIKIAGLMVLILIGGILETASASLILPLVSAVLDEEKFSSNKYVVIAMDVVGEKRAIEYYEALEETEQTDQTEEAKGDPDVTWIFEQ